MEIIIYSASGSNSSARVEWVLNYKEIEFKRIEVQNSELKTSYLNVNKYGYVPSLAVNGNIFAESMAIIEMLEELFPSNPVLPKGIYERAKVREVCEYVNSTIHSPQNGTVLNHFRPNSNQEEIVELRRQWLSVCLLRLEPMLWKQSSFVLFNEFSVADIFIACIYKKLLEFGSELNQAFTSHLNFLRQHDKICASEPKT